MPRTYNFGVQATDDIGATATRAFSIDVNNSDYDRFAYVTQSGIGRSKNGYDWFFDPSATNKGDFIFWCRDRWLLIDSALALSQTIKQSFDLRSWQTLSFSGLEAGCGISHFYYCAANDTLYLGMHYVSTSQWTLQKIPAFSTVVGTSWTVVNFQSSIVFGTSGPVTDLTVNPATNVAFVSLYSGSTLFTLDGNANTNPVSTGVAGRVWFENGVLVAYNRRNGGFDFRVSFDDGLTFIDKTPSPPAVSDTVCPFVYVNGVFSAHYRNSGNATLFVWTTNLGDTWAFGTTGGGYNTTIGGVAMALAYNNSTVILDNTGVAVVFSGNLANVHVASNSAIGGTVPALGQLGNFAAVRVEAL